MTRKTVSSPTLTKLEFCGFTLECVHLNNAREFFFAVPCKSISKLLGVKLLVVMDQINGAYPVFQITLDEGKGKEVACISFADFANLILDFYRLNNSKAIEIVKECFWIGLTNNN